MQAYEGAVIRKGQFQSHGCQCAATLHLPQGNTQSAGTAAPVPAIMMVHGWGGIQLMLITEYIKRFNELGLAVLTFDYPGWGDSEGLPRNRINPWKRVKTCEAALAFLKACPEVDASRILLWGSSFGGGHVVDLAAEHPELLGVISQVPMLDGRAAVQAVPFTRLLRFGLDITLDLLNPFATRYLPVVSEAGEYSSMDRDGAMRAHQWTVEHLSQPYDNRVAASSMMWMGLYRPIRNLGRISIPLQVIGASGDTVAPFNEQAIRRSAPAGAEVHTIDSNHFDPYLQPWFEQNFALQRTFVERLLG